MFNFWILFVLISTITMQVSLIFIKNSLHIFFISEVCWILLIVGVSVAASFYSDPRFYLFTIIFLFFAALEIVLYLITYIFKKQ